MKNKKKKLKNKKKKGEKKKEWKKRRKKKIYSQKFIKKEYNKYSLMRKKVNDAMEDSLGWLQHLVDDPCLKNKTQKNIFRAFLSSSSQPSLPLATLQAQ